MDKLICDNRVNILRKKIITLQFELFNLYLENDLLDNSIQENDKELSQLMSKTYISGSIKKV